MGIILLVFISKTLWGIKAATSKKITQEEEK